MMIGRRIIGREFLGVFDCRFVAISPETRVQFSGFEKRIKRWYSNSLAM
jgi:hypothetical protein